MLVVLSVAALALSTPLALSTRGLRVREARMTAPAGVGAPADTEWRPEGSHGTGYRFMPLDTVSDEPGPML
eukprot:scaffold33539_cov19-Tisochrysis_lutea.AAC.1